MLLVEERPVDIADRTAVLQLLLDAPSGFAERTARYRPEVADADEFSREFHMVGIRFYEAAKETGDMQTLGFAADNFSMAQAHSHERGDMYSLAEHMMYSGAIQAQAGNLEDAIRYMEPAMSFFQRQGDKERLCFCLGTMHTVTLKEARLQQTIYGSEDEALGTLLNLQRQRILENAFSMRREPVAQDAFCVGEGEIGFSSDQRIGTLGTAECVTVIVRNPDTGKIGLTHIDFANDMSTLERLFERLEEGQAVRQPPQEPFAIQLLGAGRTSIQEFDEVGEDTLIRVCQFLDTKHTRIISADVMESKQPTNVVADPKTVALEEAVPGKPNPNKVLCDGRVLVEEVGKPLHVVFDLAVSEERTAILLSQAAVRDFNEKYAGKTDIQIYNEFVPVVQKDDVTYPIMVEEVIQLKAAYEQASQYVIAALDTKIAQLSKGDKVEVDEQQYQGMIQAIMACPLHIGAGNEAANEELIKKIETSVSTGQNGNIELNVQNLSDFEFQQTPYEALEARLPSPRPDASRQTIPHGLVASVEAFMNLNQRGGVSQGTDAKVEKTVVLPGLEESVAAFVAARDAGPLGLGNGSPVYRGRPLDGKNSGAKGH